MKIIFNGELCDLVGFSVQDVLYEIGLVEVCVVMVLNGFFLFLVQCDRVLSDGDVLEVVLLMQGG